MDKRACKPTFSFNEVLQIIENEDSYEGLIAISQFVRLEDWCNYQNLELKIIFTTLVKRQSYLDHINNIK